jgi:hypothetical protein
VPTRVPEKDRLLQFAVNLSEFLLIELTDASMIGHAQTPPFEQRNLVSDRDGRLREFHAIS